VDGWILLSSAEHNMSFKSIDGEKGRQQPGLKVDATVSSLLHCIYPPSLSLRYLPHHLLI